MTDVHAVASDVLCSVPSPRGSPHVTLKSFAGIFVESALQSTRADEEKEVRSQLDEMFKRLDFSDGTSFIAARPLPGSQTRLTRHATAPSELEARALQRDA